MSAPEAVDAPREDQPFLPSPPPEPQPNGFQAFLGDPQVRLCASCLGMAIFLLPSIIGIVIASQYDAETSVCNDGTKYTVKLDLFLYIGGGVHIGAAVFDLLCNFMCVVIYKSSWSRSTQCDGGIGTFLFVWTIMGLNMYNSQMSTQCKNTPIGKMILSWSVIPLCVIAVALIALCVPFCKLVKQWMKTQI